FWLRGLPWRPLHPPRTSSTNAQKSCVLQLHDHYHRPFNSNGNFRDILDGRRLHFSLTVVVTVPMFALRQYEIFPFMKIRDYFGIACAIF
ncbi:hypothetical protein PFISCL1PPCAC_21004, partial [Pristionchus fissidentatus]